MEYSQLNNKITSEFEESILVKDQSKEKMLEPISQAIRLMVDCIQSGKKILAAGNGGSAADAQHFSAELVNRFEIERAPLPAIALTTDSSVLTSIGNDYHFDLVFQKQIEALGSTGDVLLAISTSGNSKNMITAVRKAKEKQMPVVAMTGKDGGKIGGMLSGQDVLLCVPADRTARIQEVHLLILHCLCGGLDSMLSNYNNSERV